MERRRAEQEAMAAKIRAMESKLLSGGDYGDLVGHTNQQQRALEQKNQELAEQRVSFFRCWWQV